nr:actin cytoskeleton-regulatory complex protein pan1-like [Aegilops tauschii subsp. strangulata]
MLTEVPYKVPERKEKKKKSEGRVAKEGLCSRAHLDTKFEESQAPSVLEGEQEEDEEERNSSRTRKRAALEGAEEDQPPRPPKKQCMPKLVLLDDSSDSDKESTTSKEVPKRNPRINPPAESPPCAQPTDQTLEGTSPTAELAESGSTSRSAPPPIIGETGEVLSRRTPSDLDMGGSGDEIMAEANASVTKDQEEGSLLVNKEGELSQSVPPRKTASEPPRPPKASIPHSTEGGVGVPPPAPNTGDRVAARCPDVMEEALNSSSIVAEHRALMGMVLQSNRSVNSGLKEAFGGLLTGIEASSLAAAGNAAMLDEMNQKLKSFDEELDLVSKWFDEAQAVAAEVEGLKAELKKAKEEVAKLKKAKEEADEQKAAAERAAAKLKTMKP